MRSRATRASNSFWLWACLLLLMVMPIPARASHTVALTYFDNHSGDPAFDALGHGLADMLITDLSELSTLRIVERSRLNDIMEELELSESSFVDPSTAAKLGQGLGATLIVTGSFTTIAPQMRIDARVVHVASGEVAFSTEVTGPQEEFFLLEKELALALAEQAGATITFREQARLGQVATESFDAFSEWSNGLKAMDQQAFIEAKAAIDRALQADDSFQAAQQLLKQLEQVIAEYEGKRAELFLDNQAEALSRLQAIAAAGGPYEEVENWINIDGITSDVQRYREHRELFLTVLSMQLPESHRYMNMSTNEWALYIVHMMSHELIDRSNAIVYGETYLKRYPAGSQAEIVALNLRDIKNRILEEKKGAEQAPALRHEAKVDIQRRRCRLEGEAASAPKRLPACQAWLQLVQDSNDPDQIKAARGRVATCARESANIDVLVDLIRQYPMDSNIEKNLSRVRERTQKAEEERNLNPTAKLSETLSAIDRLLLLYRMDDAGPILDTAIERWPDNPKLREYRFRQTELRGDLAQMEIDRMAIVRAAEAAYKAEEMGVRCKNTVPPKDALPLCLDWLERLHRIEDESTEFGDFKRARESAGAALLALGDQKGLRELSKQADSSTLNRWLSNLEKSQETLKKAGPSILSPTTPEQAIDHARLLREAGQLDQAAALLVQANQRWPNHLNLWYTTFEVRLQLNDEEGATAAIKAYERALKPLAEAYIAERTEDIGPEEAQRRWTGEYVAKQPEQMRRDLTRLRTKRDKLNDLPEDTTGMAVAGYATILHRGDFSKRIQILDDFPRAWKEAEAESWHRLARELYWAKQYEEAGALFTQLMTEHPEFALIPPDNLLHSAALAFKAAGRLPEAIANWQRIIEEFPDSEYLTSAEHSLQSTPR